MSIVSSIFSRSVPSANRFVSFGNLRIILSNLTGLFAVTTIMMGVMAAIAYALNEANAIPGFLAALAVSGLITVLLKLFFPRAEELELRHAMVVAAIAYLIVPAISTIPFVMIEHMTLIDGFFEAISGWTCTGLTMMPYPEHATHTIQLFRSATQWIGGIGVILLMVTILIRPGTSTFIMYQSEARKDKIKPSIRSTINMIWFLYLVLTLLGVLLLLVVGMPLWDSINHSMVAIGTGGYSIWSNSIAHYNSFSIELALDVIMIVGALPIVFIYRSVKGPKSLLNLDPEVKAYLTIIVIGVALIVGEFYLAHGDVLHSIRVGSFQFISGLTTTGLQTTDLSNWSYTAMLILSFGGIIGGCAGSTAGGLKVARALFMTKELELWMKRTLLPRNAIVTIKIGNKRLAEEAVGKELSEAALISFLYLISILVSTMILSHVVPVKYDLSIIIFSVCSAQGNVGLQPELINVGMHYLGKIVIMADMWLGRLEIIPVTLLIRAIFKGFRI